MKVTEPESNKSYEHLSNLKPALTSHKVCGASGIMRQIMFVNINSYSAGQKVLPDTTQAQQLTPPGDGLFEVSAIRNLACGLAMFAGVRPSYLFSTGAMAFTVATGEFMQQDGEPWRLDTGCDVLIRRHRTVTMLCAPANARFWGGHIRRDFWPASSASPIQ